jgi:hypothetical protein
MPLSVIGAGFGRTGTMSMKAALELLGFGPCHHMLEVNENPVQREIWRAIAAGGKADWEVAFSGYQSCADWPAAFYWREVSAYYPQAKIILTTRSSESWYESVSKTIFPSVRSSEDVDSIGVKLIGQQIFGGKLEDKHHAIAIYEKNIADVKAAFGSDRLLIYAVGDGWEPLCRFLDSPIPDAPYPRSNSSREFNRKK